MNNNEKHELLNQLKIKALINSFETDRQLMDFTSIDKSSDKAETIIITYTESTIVKILNAIKSAIK